jgi:hypothetical protein
LLINASLCMHGVQDGTACPDLEECGEAAGAPPISWFSLQSETRLRPLVRTTNTHNTLTLAPHPPLPQHLYTEWGLDYFQIQNLYFKGLVHHALTPEHTSMLHWWHEYACWLAALHELEHSGKPPAAYRTWMRAEEHIKFERYVNPHLLPKCIRILDNSMAGTSTARLGARPLIERPPPCQSHALPMCTHPPTCQCLACWGRRRAQGQERPDEGKR